MYFCVNCKYVEANILHSDILELVAIEIASRNQNSQDPLVLQCNLLIGNTLQLLVCLSIKCVFILTLIDFLITDYCLVL